MSKSIRRALLAALAISAAACFGTKHIEAASKPKNKQATEGNLSPEQLAAITFNSNDSRLTDWLTRQSATQLHDEAAPDQLKQLDDILDQTSLPSLELMTLAHNYFLKTSTLFVPRNIYRAAEKKWQAELSQAVNDSKQTRTLLNNFAKNRQNIKDVLWILMEQQRDSVAIDALQKYYAGFLKYLPADDPKMTSVAQALRTGLAEIYHTLGNDDQALALCQEAADDPTLSGSRWESNEWLWIAILAKTHKYSDAIDHLQKDFDKRNVSAQEHQQIYRVLFQFALDAQRLDLAQSTLDDWSTNFPLTEEQKKAFQARISKASQSPAALPATITPPQ